jgi:citrate synthase
VKAEEGGGMETRNIGLRGVVVADSTISKVDGEKGVLIYRGYDITALAGEGTFEEVTYLLLMNRLPTAEKLEAFRADLASWRSLPRAVADAMKCLPRQSVPMDVLQAVVPLLAAEDGEIETASRESCCRQAQRLTAVLPLVVSAWERLRRGLEIVEPDPRLGHAANFLYTLHGERPDPDTARTMDAVLVLHADHGFNASTFTARQIASTRAHIYAAVAGAVGSLSGELHGGANERVYRMLREIGSADRVRDYVTGKLEGHERIMGMGHAVYRVTDPRALILGPMAERLAEKAGRPELYETAEEVRRVTAEEFRKRKGRDIYANVDFFSAIVNAMLGIPLDLFTPVFALGRVAGWTAHYLEERFGGAHAKPALYRPKAEYVGRYCGLEGCDWKAVEDR